jgi:hypothetical protein
LSVAENPLCGGRVQSFGQRREHHGDLLRGSFQPVEGRVAPASEGGAAGLASKGLDRLSTTMLAIPDQRMDLSIGVAEVPAVPVGTSEALGVYALGSSPPAFHLAKGAAQAMALLPKRKWSRDDRRGSPEGFVA